ncbi:hypothetical protein Bca52824_080857 [Brassica carinata]|uniref:Transcription initiation factor IIA gamma subunit C-terminal domain-containing protein n=1 Tax=Brassica carinata TaxID=52824 RepID=A0A8X7PF48_BRACI|nr:hypothetical protein Bca52824_080857 [Brassica carinata]
MATFELYGRSTIGMCLTETLDEMVRLAPSYSTQVKSKVTIKGHLHTHRFCDNVWTFILQCSRVKTVKRM